MTDNLRNWIFNECIKERVGSYECNSNRPTFTNSFTPLRISINHPSSTEKAPIKTFVLRITPTCFIEFGIILNTPTHWYVLLARKSPQIFGWCVYFFQWFLKVWLFFFGMLLNLFFYYINFGGYFRQSLRNTHCFDDWSSSKLLLNLDV